MCESTLVRSCVRVVYQYKSQIEFYMLSNKNQYDNVFIFTPVDAWVFVDLIEKPPQIWLENVESTPRNVYFLLFNKFW